MAFDRVANIPFRIFQRRASGDTAGQIKHPGGPVVPGLLKDDRVSDAHLLLLQSRRRFGFHGCLCNPQFGGTTLYGFDNNLYVVSQSNEEAHEAFHGIAPELACQHR